MRTSRESRRHSMGREAGLTLVEMLVAMVILGFVMALVSEVVYQVSQVARAADAVSRGSATRWATGWSVNGLFANLLAPEEAGDDPVLVGTTRRISGYTAQPLDGSDRGIQPFELELRADPNGSKATELVSVGSLGARTSSVAAVVAQFPGRAEFMFLDHAGISQSAWPPLARSDQAVEALPEAVIVRDPDSGRLMMWYGFQGEINKPRRSTNPFETPVQ